MLNSTQNYYSRFYRLSGIILLMIFHTSLTSQCTLLVTDIWSPSSCYSADGTFKIQAINNGCARKIAVYKNGRPYATGVGTLNLAELSSAVYEVVADTDCGCPSPDSRIITMSGGSPTAIIPHIDGGIGYVQANKIAVCRGSNIKIGIQSLGTTNVSLKRPNGTVSTIPNGSTFWNLSNLQPAQSGIYTISYTNAKGCISTTNITVTVGQLQVSLGADKEACVGTAHTLTASTSGASTCKPYCSPNVDSLLVRWTLDQCNASNQTNQNSYTEFLPTYPSKGNCTTITASNMYRSQGDHSCTPVIGSYSNDIGICVPAMDSCDPSTYDPNLAVKVEVTMTPKEAGRLTKLSFREQSPVTWITTNGSSGPNNINTKYLLRVYKNDLLIYSEDNRPTEKTWNVETIDFSSIPAFNITETSTFRFELRGYCVINSGGNMSGWELDDIRIFGGCCDGLPVDNSVSYLWSNGATTASINVNPLTTTDYAVTATDCNGCTHADTIKIIVNPLPTAAISGNLNICTGGSTVLTASGGASYVWSTGATTANINLSPLNTQTYTVTVTSNKGCTAKAEATIVVTPLPSPMISGKLEICLGESTTLTATGGLSYEWSTGATTNQITVSPTEGTTYRVLALNGNGCMEYTSVFVKVNPVPNPILSGPSEICSGNSATISVTGGGTYSWSNGNTSDHIVVSPLENTTYTVTVTNSDLCTATAHKSVQVNPLPVVIISGNASFCNGISSILTASGGASYAWSTGAITSSITINPSFNTTYTVTVTSAKGCVATASRMA
ncbi:MAG: hypothetical protein WAU01_12610, partial [Saprospiraceae bacterium]